MKSLGQIAYEADATKLGWKSPFTGQTLKEWDTLKIMNPIVAEAWECAAMMVADRPHLNIGPEQTQINTTAWRASGTAIAEHQSSRSDVLRGTTRKVG